MPENPRKLGSGGIRAERPGIAKVRPHPSGLKISSSRSWIEILRSLYITRASREETPGLNISIEILKISRQGRNPEWPQGPESLLSRFWVTLGRSARVTLESLLGHFHSFWVFVEFPKGPKIENFSRSWKFQARLKISSEPPTKPPFLWGNSEGQDWNVQGQDWNVQARLKISSEIEFFQSHWALRAGFGLQFWISVENLLSQGPLRWVGMSRAFCTN